MRLTTKLTVGDRLQAGRALQLDHVEDRLVLDLAQVVASILPALKSARACCSSGGRSRLPTWSARNGGSGRELIGLVASRRPAFPNHLLLASRLAGRELHSCWRCVGPSPANSDNFDANILTSWYCSGRCSKRASKHPLRAPATGVRSERANTRCGRRNRRRLVGPIGVCATDSTLNASIYIRMQATVPVPEAARARRGRCAADRRPDRPRRAAAAARRPPPSA